MSHIFSEFQAIIVIFIIEEQKLLCDQVIGWRFEATTQTERLGSVFSLFAALCWVGVRSFASGAAICLEVKEWG